MCHHVILAGEVEAASIVMESSPLAPPWLLPGAVQGGEGAVHDGDLVQPGGEGGLKEGDGEVMPLQVPHWRSTYERWRRSG